MTSKTAFLTVDYEDYRRQELRDNFRADEPAHPDEVVAQTEILLSLFENIGARATFFSVGRLTQELPAHIWSDIVKSHELGCHGYEHHRVDAIGVDGFRADLRKAKSALEDAAGVSVTAFRAPYFSVDGCESWFGRVLAEEGFSIDSSLRMSSLPGENGCCDLPGSDGAVVEVPLPSVGVGPKRLTVIGGTYFRLLPLIMIRQLLARASAQGFTPMVYLHPYDLDPSADPLDYPKRGYFSKKMGDKMRRMGRTSASAKLRALSQEYSFQPIAVS